MEDPIEMPGELQLKYNTLIYFLIVFLKQRAIERRYLQYQKKR